MHVKSALYCTGFRTAQSACNIKIFTTATQVVVSLKMACILLGCSCSQIFSVIYVICRCVCVYICVCVYVCVYMCVYGVSVYMCVCIYVCVLWVVCVYMCVRVCHKGLPLTVPV